ncbi:hypothetical protein F4604DRAFT_1681902 [Suillus subluteus]|nr:hypothetical protein F4604DRAFT_1681902 [Suillus subluteus]
MNGAKDYKIQKAQIAELLSMLLVLYSLDTANMTNDKTRLVWKGVVKIMLCSNQRGQGGGVQANAPASTDTGKKCTIHWEGVTHTVFSNDEDLEVQQLFKENPKAFIKPVSTHFGITQKKIQQVQQGPQAVRSRKDVYRAPRGSKDEVVDHLSFMAGGRPTQPSTMPSLLQM